MIDSSPMGARGILSVPFGLLALALAVPPASAQSAEESRMLAHSNLHRRGVDLEPFVLDSDLSRTCMLHALYLDRNNQNGHDEDPRLPLYSKEGHEAGQASVLAYSSPEVSVELWMDSFLHRIPIITPIGDKAGVAWYAGKTKTVAALDSRRKHDVSRNKDRVILWPPQDAVGIPTQMSNEIPNPTPYPRSDQAGYPVTVTFHPRKKLTKASGRLLAGIEVVPCFFSSPEEPTVAGALLQQNSLALIPKGPVKHGALHRAEFSVEVDGEPRTIAWTFTTGNRRDLFKWIERRIATAMATEARAAHEKGKAEAAASSAARRVAGDAVRALRAATEESLPKALAEARAMLASLVPADRPPLAAEIRAVEDRVAEEVDRAAAEAARLVAEGRHADAIAALEAVLPRAALVPARAAEVERLVERAREAAADASGPAWMTLLEARIPPGDRAWMLPAAPPDHLREEDGGIVLDARKDPVALAYLGEAQGWKDYDLSLDVQVEGGAFLCARARLADDGTFAGTFFPLEATAARWTELTVRVRGASILLRCGPREETRTADQPSGGFALHVGRGERIRVRNIRVRVRPEPDGAATAGR